MDSFAQATMDAADCFLACSAVHYISTLLVAKYWHILYILYYLHICLENSIKTIESM